VINERHGNYYFITGRNAKRARIRNYTRKGDVERLCSYKYYLSGNRSGLGFGTSIAAGLANEENRRWTKRITVGGAATITAVTALMALFHPQESMALLNVLSVQYVELATQFALDASHVPPGADEDLKLRASYSQKLKSIISTDGRNYRKYWNEYIHQCSFNAKYTEIDYTI
jgi:hypothetical protein